MTDPTVQHIPDDMIARAIDARPWGDLGPSVGDMIDEFDIELVMRSALAAALAGGAEPVGEFIGYGRIGVDPCVRMSEGLAPGTKLYAAPCVAPEAVRGLADAVRRYQLAVEAANNNPAMLLSDSASRDKCIANMDELESARAEMFALTAAPEGRDADPTSEAYALSMLTDKEGRPFAAPASGEAQDDAPDVMVCRIGDYGALDKREWATVIYDDKKIAECYTNEDAEFVGAALRLYAASEGESREQD